jgi:PilZ domain
MSPADENDQALNELVESDVDFLEGVPPDYVPTETREHPRYPFRGRAQAVVFPPEDRQTEEPQECEVLTTDVSRSGLSLLHRKQLYPGQQILLVLNGANRLVEVCWCCRVWSGLYSAGCRFVGVPATKDATG